MSYARPLIMTVPPPNQSMGPEPDQPTRPGRLVLGPDIDATLDVLERVLAAGLGGFAYVDRDLRFRRVNGTLARLNGVRPHDLVGRTMAEVLGPRYWKTVSGHVERALRGESIIEIPLTRDTVAMDAATAHPNLTWAQFSAGAPVPAKRHVLVSYYPAEYRNEAAGIVIVVKDVTEQVQTETALRETETRYRMLAETTMKQARLDKAHRFLLELNSRMHTVQESEELLWQVVESLGRHLEADRCAYVEIDWRTNSLAIYRDYAYGVPSIAGTYARGDFGPEVRDLLATGRTVAIGDTRSDHRTADYHTATYGPLMIGACLNVPVMNYGKQVATLTVQQRVPREWSEDEVALVEAVADRTWLAVENARLNRISRQIEASHRAFLHDVLSSVTEGRLHLCQTVDELPARLRQVGSEFPLVDASQISPLRHAVRDLAVEMHFEQSRIMDLVTATGEAGMNALVHAAGGSARIGTDGHDTIQVWVTDHGAGIPIEELPQATLSVGYSTKASLGHGFKIMLHTADRVYLLTEAIGTTIVIEHFRKEPATVF
ncbi:MAG: GAF domain-containing protein [Capsulimonadaceae bacterium]